jgi:hypothetical protein
MADLKVAVDELAAAIAAAAQAQAQLSALLDTASVGAAKVQELATPVLPPPSVKGWGPGPKSGLPWHSGARCQSVAQVLAFIRAGRPGKDLDVIQCFNGREQADTWDEVAGGKTDSLTEFSGTLSMTEGQKGASFIWKQFPDLAAVLTYRPIPETESNRKGKNPQVWQKIAAGDFDWAYRRAGRKFAGLDAQFPRTGRLALEIAREFTGDWDQHSAVNAAQWFPDAWARIVNGLRAGYRDGSGGKDMPYQICLRPARNPIANGVWTEAWLPPSETWDLIGISQHDNGWAPCTPQDRRRNWRRDGNAEGLDNIAEIAIKRDKGIFIAEWSSHHPDSDNKSGPHPDLFLQSMFDWFMAVKDRLAGETYFLSSDTTLEPNWPATAAYRRLWGGA